MKFPQCEQRGCRFNQNLKCKFLNANGESKHEVENERLVMLCAWEDCGRTEKCESCFSFSYYKGRQFCNLKGKLIPKGRKACGYYQKTKV